MTKTDSQTIDKENLKRFLYGELDKAERIRLEDRMYADDTLFEEAEILENELIDYYVRGKLPAEEKTRFERSLKKLPQRRQKVANAAALREYIAEERASEKVAEKTPEKIPFWQRVNKLFRFDSPVLQYGMAALVVVLTLSTAFLFISKNRTENELARLQQERADDSRIRQLEQQIAASRQRETELQTQLDNAQGGYGEATEDLENESRRREQLERELAKAKQQKPVDKPDQTQTPIIASIVLSLSGGGRGATNSGEMPIVKIPRNASKVLLNMRLPDTVAENERLTVQVNGQRMTTNLPPRVSSGGVKSLRVLISAANLKDQNEVVITDKSGKTVSSYPFKLERQ